MIAQEFEQAVEENKLMRVRIMIKDSMVVDPSLKEFKELLKYAESKLPNLFLAHDGEKLIYDITAWTKDYMDHQMVILINNFSKERIELLESVVQKVYGTRVKAIENERNQAKESSSSLSRKQIGAGVTVAGAVIVVAGVCVSEGAIIVVGAVTAVAGIAMIITDK